MKLFVSRKKYDLLNKEYLLLNDNYEELKNAYKEKNDRVFSMYNNISNINIEEIERIYDFIKESLLK